MGSTIDGSSFSGLLTRVEIGHMRIGSAGNGWMNRLDSELSPLSHPAMGRVVASFEPCWLGDATGRGAEPST
jgi:hypothetical protein